MTGNAALWEYVTPVTGTVSLVSKEGSFLAYAAHNDDFFQNLLFWYQQNKRILKLVVLARREACALTTGGHWVQAALAGH